MWGATRHIHDERSKSAVTPLAPALLVGSKCYYPLGGQGCQALITLVWPPGGHANLGVAIRARVRDRKGGFLFLKDRGNFPKDQGNLLPVYPASGVFQQ